MSVFKTRAIGTDELANALRSLPGRVGTNAIRRSLAKGARVLANESKRIARGSRDTGALARAITVTTDARGKTGQPTGYVYIRSRKQTRRTSDGRIVIRNPRLYAHLVEFGTSPHRIRRKSGKTIDHPGAKPRPFLRPAFLSKSRSAQAVTTESLRVEVVKAIEKSKVPRRSSRG